MKRSLVNLFYRQEKKDLLINTGTAIENSRSVKSRISDPYSFDTDRDQDPAF